MYKITEAGGTEHYSETIVPIRVGNNGCYVRPKAGQEVDGFVGKVALATEDGYTVVDTVFVLPEHTLRGGETEATYEHVEGAAHIAELGEANEVLSVLLGGNVE